ncbi:acid phosphatase 1 isoform X1 [Dendrobium catenatum]|uniref:Acid phosphatase 1 n=2 Tax=Dendrobium catenatum TaxID=906689 RepID=A0A2I0VUQ6_9ASPA|nr:acid phosphatase 1 isoform X1 [Dendrobium catenatum]PKU67129.1 Acid phosphatase 1 [Dendrobium catenatum]
MNKETSTMASRASLWFLWLLSLCLTTEILALENDSYSWSNILQLLEAQCVAKRGDEDLEKGKELTHKNYCESWRFNVELHNIRDFNSIPDECASSVGKYMSSSLYKSDVRRVADEASRFLTNSFRLAGDSRDAWVFDVDDTLLSTVPFYKKHHFGEIVDCRSDPPDRASLEKWMAKGKATVIDDMLSLFREINSKGLDIFIISWRPEHLRAATVDNLFKAGYHGWTKLILRCDEESYVDAQSYKSEQRKKLVEQGYRLWGIVGSQWSSLNGHSTAKRAFKLPNPMYYL